MTGGGAPPRTSPQPPFVPPVGPIGRGPEGALREALGLWAVAFGALALTTVIWPSQAKLVATAFFLYLPIWVARRRGEGLVDYGLRFDRWRQDLLWAGILTLLIIPLFVLAFPVFGRALTILPPEWATRLSPLITQPDFHLRLPADFGLWALDHLLVVALPEELFYRGYLQARLRDVWPEGRRLFGARLGRAFWVTQLLFALGHLAILQPWRLAVFFPALAFGWLREKTGTIVGAVLFHALCNLTIMVLEASFYGLHQ